MRFRYVVLLVMSVALVLGGFMPRVAQAQQQGEAPPSSVTPLQRLEVMRTRLETMRRTLNSALAGLNARDTGAKEAPPDDPRVRLRGLEKEVSTLLSEVSDARGKQERAEKYDSGILDKLEDGVKDLGDRVDAGMRATASARQSTGGEAAGQDGKKKKGGGLISRLLGRGGNEKYEELVGSVAPGRDRELFEEATRQARKNNYETSRDLFQVIITTYPDSPFLPLSKLAVADTFYLEGTTSALILAAQYYQDWLAFFPTDPLADDVMLKLAEVEMRQMGLPDRQTAAARKAEQRIKVLMQQFPNTSLRPDAEIRLREIQENLAMHDFMVGNQYFARYLQQKAANPKGAQSRFLEIAKKYPNFSYMDEVLYRLGVTYVEEEEPDEAAKYFQQLVRNHPNSKMTEKAREQLQSMGLAVPEPDPQKLTELPPERPGRLGQLWTELRGTTPATIDKKGILISGNDKAQDLIQEAIENNGQLNHSAPTAPVQRRAPARPVEALQPPPKPKAPADKTVDGNTAQPALPGAPRGSSSDPAVPASNPTTPANLAPPPATTPPPPLSDAKPKP